MDIHVNPAYEPLFTTRQRYVILKGGAGSGKSHSVTQFLLSVLLTRPRFRILAMHKYYASIRETLYAGITRLIHSLDLADQFELKTSPFSVKCIATGAEILFMGLDDPEKLKSLAGIGMIWWEEATMFELKEFLQANARMRGADAAYPYQFLMCLNPTSELHWIKSTFFDDGNPYAGRSLLLETTLRDNHYLDEEYRQELEANARINPEWGRVYLDGEWGRVNPDGLFYKNFNSQLHVSPVAQYDPVLPLYLSFDFNVMPSVTCLVYQLPAPGVLHQVDEITLTSPHNNTKAVCQRVLQRYATHRAVVFVTGDPAGRHEDTRSEQGFNDYTIISNELAALCPRQIVPRSAPNQIQRGAFINALFASWRDYVILINPACRKTIEDLTYQQETPKGKDKPKVRVEGVTYEKLGHASDCLDMMICTVWAQEFREFSIGAKAFEPLIGRSSFRYDD